MPAAGVATATKAAVGTTAATSVSSGSGGGVSVCSLLTSAQASSLNNVTYGAATPQRVQAGFNSCTYANTGQHASPVDIQALTVQVISIAGCYTQLQDAEGPGTKVTGVGDDAFGYEIGIVVKSGNTCIEISGLTVAELSGNYGPDTAMAKIILANLH